MTSQISTLKSFQVNRAFRFDWKSASEKPCSKSRLGNQRHSWAQFGTETQSFVNLTPSYCPTSRKENRETLWSTGPPDWSANACGTVNFGGSRWGATRATGGLCGAWSLGQNFSAFAALGHSGSHAKSCQNPPSKSDHFGPQSSWSPMSHFPWWDHLWLALTPTFTRWNDVERFIASSPASGQILLKSHRAHVYGVYSACPALSLGSREQGEHGDCSASPNPVQPRKGV